jgi:protein SCO1
MKVAIGRMFCAVALSTNMMSMTLAAGPRSLIADEKPQNRLTIDLPDIDVQDQDSVNRLFVTDVMGGKLVAINFIFTTCTAVCPTQSLILRKLQDQLGNELGKDFSLISVSIDPQKDTPQRLKNYAHEKGAKPGWHWITGKKANIDQILYKAGIPRGDVANHPAMILLGDPRVGEWIRFYGFPKAEELLEGLKQFQAQRRGRNV